MLQYAEEGDALPNTMTAHGNGTENASHAEVWWRRKPNPLQRSAEGVRMRFNNLSEMNNDQIPPRLVMHRDFSEFKSEIGRASCRERV